MNAPPKINSPANSQTTDSSTAEILMADTDLSTNQLLDVPLEDQYLRITQINECTAQNKCKDSKIINYSFDNTSPLFLGS
jgi:hypothetical protein